MQNIIKDCEFCLKFPDKKIPLVMETEHFYVKVDESPLVVGHLMIISKEHFGCTGEVPEHLRSELLELIELVSEKTRGIYGTVSLYEHGRAGHCVPMAKGEGVCEHFHLHILPLEIDTNIDFEPYEVDVHKSKFTDSFSDLFLFFERYGNYLYLSNSKNEQSLYAVDPMTMPSHFLRTVISSANGQPERSDWLLSKSHDESLLTLNNWNKAD